MIRAYELSRNSGRVLNGAARSTSVGRELRSREIVNDVRCRCSSPARWGLLATDCLCAGGYYYEAAPPTFLYELLCGLPTFPYVYVQEQSKLRFAELVMVMARGPHRMLSCGMWDVGTSHITITCWAVAWRGACGLRCCGGACGL
jgi:hypothetical protein